MKPSLLPSLLLALTLICSSCIRETTFSDTPEGNFEALWRIIDRQYCFFDYKSAQYGLDWDDIYQRYKQRLSPTMSSRALFQVLSEMLLELRDGHTNLISTAQTSYYTKWYDDYPANYSDTLQRIYLGTDYVTTSSMQYKVFQDNIAYLRYASFSSAISEGGLDAILSDVSLCDGLILDIRNNGGGLLTNSEKIAARFTNEKTIAGYMFHKTGYGHNDFSSPITIYTTPANSRVRWQKPVVVLTNRRTFSSANDFVCRMKQLPNVTIIGDRTGGGSGLPTSSELPNGWSVRFSACPMFDADMQQTEFGIDPDIKVDIQSADFNQGIDTIIEAARQYLHKKIAQ